MSWIKVTDVGDLSHPTCWINSERIDCLYSRNKGGMVVMPSRGLITKETPEEIIARIKASHETIVLKEEPEAHRGPQPSDSRPIEMACAVCKRPPKYNAPEYPYCDEYCRDLSYRGVDPKNAKLEE